MKFIATLFATVASIAVASAQAQTNSGPIISVTSPLTGTKYRAGTDVIIAWTDPKVDIISQITLAKGKSTALTVLRPIANNVQAKDMKYTWSVPKDLPDGDDYAFEFGTSPNIAFAGPFTIEGGTGASSGGVTSGSPASPAAPGVAGAPAAGGATPAGPSSPSSTGTTGTTANGAMTSHSSAGAITQVCPKVVLGLTAFAAYHFL
ncbi:hypothetical protein K501DRAFT_191762 [Backusella circina FSU 941]|nr:hypothetical protein K501DRAFT_191762 [Backusella circina FSU 941]